MVGGIVLMIAPPLAGLLFAKDPELIFSTSLLLIIPLILFLTFRRKMPWNT
jgi:hypothetical protein